MKGKRVFFFFVQVISLFNIVKLFRVCPLIFSYKEKEFLRKSLCFCMVMLLLYLLKFIHSYIEFFPTTTASNNYTQEEYDFIMGAMYPNLGHQKLKEKEEALETAYLFQ